jgi:uncharacterized DUF497 family protein
MKFEWDPEKSRSNKEKHGIDFSSAMELWDDVDRVEIRAPYPLEDRYIVIGKIRDRLWTAIYTSRKGVVRIISVRHSRKREAALYGQEDAGEKS